MLDYPFLLTQELLFESYLLKHLLDAFVGVLLKRVEVVPDGANEDYWVLGDDGDAVAQEV